MPKNNDAVKKWNKDLADIRNVLNLTPGIEMEDGSVFVGRTDEGNWVFTTPADIGVTMTFNNAVRSVRMLNEKKALGHNDWKIPDLKTLKLLQENQSEGSLKDTFNTTTHKIVYGEGGHVDAPGLYWSSHGSSSWSWYLNAYDGSSSYLHANNNLSCRPVRIVAA